MRFLANADLAYSTKVSIANGVGKFLYVYGYITKDDFDVIKELFRAEVQRWSTKAISEDVVLKILYGLSARGNNFTRSRNAAVAAILASVGMRISQLLDMRADQYQVGDYLTFTFPRKKARKVTQEIEYERRNLSIDKRIGDEYLVDYINSYLEERQHIDSNLFIINRNGQRITEKYFQKTFVELSERLKLPKVTPHSFRHYLGTKLANEKGLLVAHKALGHTDLNMTKRYLEYDEESFTY